MRYSMVLLSRCCAGLIGPALHMMDRLAVNRGRFGILELLDVLRRQLRAIHLERAGARASEAAHVIEQERADAEAFILEVELDGVFARRERVGAFPFDAL